MPCGTTPGSRRNRRAYVRATCSRPRRRSCGDHGVIGAVRTPFGRLGGGLAGTPRPSSARSRSAPRSSASGIEPARSRVRRHGTGAPGGRRAGARAAGGDRRGDPEGGAGGHDQQGVRLVDPRDRARRPDDPRRAARRRRHRRDGVDVERAVPACRRRASGTSSATARSSTTWSSTVSRRRSTGSTWWSRPRSSRASSGSPARIRTPGRSARTSVPRLRRTPAASRRRSSRWATSSPTSGSAATRPSRSSLR